jgi:phenylacetate-CoA ligase
MNPLDKWTLGKIGAESGKLSRKHIEDWQLHRLNETIRYAREKAPFYRESLPDISLHCLSDLQGFPLMSATDIRQQGKRMICVRPSEIKRIVTMNTSGTTGNPKRLYFSEHDIGFTVDYFENGMKNVVKPGYTTMVFFPCKKPDSVGELLCRGLKNLNVFSIPFGPPKGNYTEVIDIMLQNSVSCAVGSPGDIADIAEFSAKSGTACRIALNMRSVLVSSDYVSPEHRAIILSAWDCTVHEHYGMTEMGLGCAVTCHALEGYHIRECDLYIEIVDPVTKHTLPDGDYGEIVFTSLTREAMPLIRYRTGDVSRIINKSCPCGSPLKRLERVGQRNNK